MERKTICQECHRETVDRSEYSDYTLRELFLQKGLEVATDMREIYQMINILPKDFLPERTIMWELITRTEKILTEKKKNP